VRTLAQLPLAEVAVETKHLKSRREAFFLEPTVERLSALAPRVLPSVPRSSAVNVVNIQKVNARLPTAGTYRTAVMLHHLALEAIRERFMLLGVEVQAIPAILQVVLQRTPAPKAEAPTLEHFRPCPSLGGTGITVYATVAVRHLALHA
jgi:hypothetical protein